MANKFPKTLYVKIEKDGSTEYFVSDADAASLVEMGQAVVLAKYELADTRVAKGVADFGKARRSR